MIRSARCFLFALVCLLSAPSLLAQQIREISTPAATVRVTGVSLADVQPDRIRLDARCTLDPERSVTLRRLSFSAMRLNNIPVYVAPVEEQFELKKGQMVDLPDLQIVVYYRDLESLEPVRQMIEQERAHLSGQAVAELQAGLLEKLALRSTHPKVLLPFNKDVPLQIPGGEVGRSAALATLAVTQPVAGSLGQILGAILPSGESGWQHDLAARESRHMVWIHTTYTAIAGKTSYPVEFDQIGFWIDRSTALVTAEAIRPWEFDPEADREFTSEKAHIDKDSVSITVRPVASLTQASAGQSGAGWSLRSGDFRVEFEGKPAADRVAIAKGMETTEVRRRNLPTNYALLRFRDNAPGDPVEESAAGQGSDDRLAVFRIVRDASDNLALETVLLPGSADGQQIHFNEHIDDSAFGSPVVTANGVIGMVQDEDGGTVLAAMKHLPAE